MKEKLLAEHDKCTGCGICAAVCVTNSIRMVVDKEGFAFPKIESGCIDCGVCSRSCPIINRPIMSYIDQEACIAIHRDKELWNKSSSGGAFSAICQLFGDDKTIIFGALFDADSKRIRHDCVEGVNNIGIFRGSKYVQSDLGDCLFKLKKHLDCGRKVIFSGTPCQVSAVRKFLAGKCYKNLLCIDLICHGVGSPAIFQSYIDYLEKRSQSKVINYNFRHKIIKYGIQRLYNSQVTYANGLVTIMPDDAYLNLFMQKIICRRSCDCCDYTCTQRMGDLTIGDAKQMYTIIPAATGSRNGSVVICNTSTGKVIFDCLSEMMITYPCEVKDIIKTNPPFSKCVHSSPVRKSVFKHYTKGCDMALFMSRWTRKLTLMQKIKACVPEKFKGIIKKLLMGG